MWTALLPIFFSWWRVDQVSLTSEQQNYSSTFVFQTVDGENEVKSVCLRETYIVFIVIRRVEPLRTKEVSYSWCGTLRVLCLALQSCGLGPSSHIALHLVLCFLGSKNNEAKHTTEKGSSFQSQVARTSTWSIASINFTGILNVSSTSATLTLSDHTIRNRGLTVFDNKGSDLGSAL